MGKSEIKSSLDQENDLSDDALEGVVGGSGAFGMKKNIKDGKQFNTNDMQTSSFDGSQSAQTHGNTEGQKSSPGTGHKGISSEISMIERDLIKSHAQVAKDFAEFLKPSEPHKLSEYGDIGKSPGHHDGGKTGYDLTGKQDPLNKEFGDFLKSQPKTAAEFSNYLNNQMHDGAKGAADDSKNMQAAEKKFEAIETVLDNTIDQAIAKIKQDGNLFNTLLNNIEDAAHDRVSSMNTAKFKG